MKSLGIWKHPETGQQRVYCNAAPVGAKVWFEERKGEPIDFEVCHSGRMQRDQDCQIAQDALAAAGIEFQTATFQTILQAG